MKGKICVISGASSGLGFAAALALAERGAETILLCRLEERGVEARGKIRQQTGNKAVHAFGADLSCRNAVIRLAKTIRQRWERVDVLINNAALILSERQTNAEGIEMQFAVNYLAPFLLTRELLPALQRSDDARVLNLSSNNHFRARINFEDLQSSANYGILRAYGQSKLALVLFTRELHRRLQRAGHTQIGVHAIDPGFVNTSIGLKYTNFWHRLAWWIRKQQGLSPTKGARTMVHVATSPELKGMSGQYWANGKAVRSSEASYREADARRLWAVSLELSGLDRFFLD